MAVYGSRTQLLRWRSLVAVALVLTLMWLWVQRGDSYTFQKNVVYFEEGIELPTYAAPFTCNYSALPPKTRLVNREDEGYVVLGHGFPDMITDKFWQGNGTYGWEESLVRQMNYYISAIKSFDPTRDGFMDLGANIGTHALFMAAQGHNVHIFEPTHANYQLMQCSLAMSGIKGRVRLNTFGLGDKPLSVCMRSTKDNFGDSRVDQTAKSCGPEQQALVGTIDHYYRTFLRGQKIAAFKIDIQGFEVAALHHATELFDSEDAPVAVFFEYDPKMIKDQGADPLELAKYFWSRDYSIWRDQLPGPVTEQIFARYGTEANWAGGIDLFAVKNSWKKKMDEAGFKFAGGELLPHDGHGETTLLAGHAVHKEMRNREVS